MSLNWIVTDRLTDEVVYAYTAETPTEWPGMEFSSCNHTKVKATEVVLSSWVTKLAFVTMLGTSLNVILEASKTSIELETFVKMIDWATPNPDGTSIDLKDTRVIEGLSQLEAFGLLPPGRALEIINGNNT